MVDKGAAAHPALERAGRGKEELTKHVGEMSGWKPATASRRLTLPVGHGEPEDQVDCW